MLKKLFSPFKINELILPNRLIRAPLFEPYCPDGVPTDRLITIHERHVEGGVGLTTTGFFGVMPEGRNTPFQCDLSVCTKDDFLPLVDRVHSLDGYIACDLSFVPPTFHFRHDDYPDELSLQPITQAYVNAAVLCKETGFDAIEIGPFFISAFTYGERNTRTDSYGADLLAYPSLLISQIREAVGDSFPVILKQGMELSMSAPELDEIVSVALRLEEAGVDCIVACSREEIVTTNELYLWEGALAVRDALEIPVCYSGGVDAENIEDVMSEFELVHVGRSLLRDYDFPIKLMRGEEPEACVKCNGCFGPIFAADSPELKCVFDS